METWNELRIVASAQSYINERYNHSVFGPFISKLASILNRILGTDLLLENKSVFSTNFDIGPQLMSKIQGLKKIGVIDGLSINSQLLADEPFQYTTTALDFGYGHDFFSLEKSIERALGESVERYLWFRTSFFYENRTVTAPYSQMDKQQTLNIFSLSGFSEEQRKNTPKFNFDSETKFSWLPAYNLIEDRFIYCPTSLFSAFYSSRAYEPQLRWNMSTGLAAGGTLESAYLNGVLEMIERDAFMINYLNRLSPPEFDLSELRKSDQKINDAVGRLERYEIEPQVFSLATDFPVTVAFAILKDKTGKGPAVAVGAKAAFDAKQAILHALSEATSVRYILRDRAAKKLASNKMGRLGRLEYWGKLENRDKLDFICNGREKISTFRGGSPKETTAKENLAILIEGFKAKNYGIYGVDMTTPKIRAIGYRGVSLFSPDLQPLHLEETLPYFSGPRLKAVPLSLGYPAAQQINTVPHPFP